MVFFDQRNPSMGLLRNLEIRNHKNIDHIDINKEKELSRHALNNALKRWRKWIVDGLHTDSIIWSWKAAVTIIPNPKIYSITGSPEF